MTATLDILQLPPYGTDEQRFALVLSDWDGPPLPAEQLTGMAKAVGAVHTIVFTRPVLVGETFDEGTVLTESDVSLTLSLKPQVDKDAMAKLLDSVKQRVAKATQPEQAEAAAPKAETRTKTRSKPKTSGTES